MNAEKLVVDDCGERHGLEYLEEGVIYTFRVLPST